MDIRISMLLNDADYALVLKQILESHGWQVKIHKTDVELLKNLETIDSNIIVCSYNLPNFNGLSFLQLVQSKSPKMGVFFTSKTNDEELISSVLRANNTDIMVKPVATEEFVARIKNLWLRCNGKDTDSSEVIKTKNLTIDVSQKLVTLKGKEITLSPTEFRLLLYLVKNEQKVLSREVILDNVWGDESYVSTRIVDVYIGYLREKLDNKDDPKFLITVPGFGYKFQA